MRTIRWISYTQQNIPGNQSFELTFHASLDEVRIEFENFCCDVDTDDCSMTLYNVDHPDGQNMIELANEFADVGCPFDYPDKIVERGPRGGIRFVNT